MQLLHFFTRYRLMLVLAIVGHFGHPMAFGQQFRLRQSPPRNSSKIKPPSVKAWRGPLIPGLRQGAIPQGIAFAQPYNRLLISHYFKKAPACISVMNNVTGRMTSCVTLQEPSGKMHYGHVGGIAVVNDSLFVASEGRVLQYKLAEFVARKSRSTACATTAYKCDTKASFCTATSDMLLVGEFAYGKKYPTDPSHHLKDRKGVRKYAWVCAYDTNKLFRQPQWVLSVRQKVQGMCVSGDRIYLSVSFGRANRSKIVVYRNPIGKAAHKMVKVRPGVKVPLWFLDGNNYIGEIDFPPMSEGIVMVGKKLAVLSESGAAKYQSGGKGPLDRIILLDVSRFK